MDITTQPAVETGAPVAREQATSAAWYRRWRTDLLLAVAVLLLTVPVVEPLMAQQASRYALTAALWDQHTVVVDDYAAILTVDKATRGGQLYSDKAPGQPVLAIPAYAVYRLLGGEPATSERFLGNLGLWAVSLWTSALPAAGLAVVMRRLARRVAPRRATAAALALAVGTMLLPFATVVFSHVLAGFFLAAAYLVLLRRPGTAVSLYAAGFLAAVAVTVEYTSALAGFVLFGAAVAWHGWRTGWFLAGGIVPGALLAAYQTVAFGGPLTFSYEFSNFREHDSGLVGMGVPKAGMAADVLFGDRGLFFLTPILLMAVIGALLLLADAKRRHFGVVALIVFGLYLVHMAGWGNATGGASPGARYVVPSLPFLVVGAAEAFRRWPRISSVAAAVSAATMTLATFTLPLAPRDEPFALTYWWQRAVNGEWTDTLLTLVWDDWAVFVPITAAAALAVWIVRTEQVDVGAWSAAP